MTWCPICGSETDANGQCFEALPPLPATGQAAGDSVGEQIKTAPAGTGAIPTETEEESLVDTLNYTCTQTGHATETYVRPPYRPDETCLYRAWIGEELAYIGITRNPDGRFSKHRYQKTWWPAVDRIDIEWFSTRQDALRAESEAIYAECPRFNVARTRSWF